MPDYAAPRVRNGSYNTGNPDSDASLLAEDQYRQTGVVPDGYTVLENGTLHPTGDMNSFMDKHGWELMAGLVGGGTVGGLAAGAGFGGGGAAAASSGIPDIASTEGMGGLSFGGGGAAAAGGGMTASNYLDLGKLAADFTGGLLSPKPQKRQSYHGALTNPEDSLFMAMNAIQRLGSGLDDKIKGGVHLRALLPNSAPEPVSIPGLNVKIGGTQPGGPHLDEGFDLPGFETFGPFNGYGQNLFQSSNPSAPKTPARRRNP